MVAVNQNAWPVLSGYGDDRLVRIPYITGKVRGGDVAWMLSDFVTWFHHNIEALDIGTDDDWGFAPRNIAGTGVISNHACGIAVDLNAVRHPMFRDTMDADKESRIRARLKRYKGAIRWGGDYRSGRIDQMHFEINVTASRLRVIVAELKNVGNVKPTAPTKPKPRPPVAAKPPVVSKPVKKSWPQVALRVDGDFSGLSVEALQVLLKGIDLYDGKIDGEFQKLTKIGLQQLLKQWGEYKGLLDGNFQSLSIMALQRGLKKRGHYSGKIDGRWQGMTTEGLQSYINSQTKHFK